jgi:hypothetical protein
MRHLIFSAQAFGRAAAVARRFGFWLALLLIGAGCATRIAPRPKIPATHTGALADATVRGGDTASARYLMAYESFWWNCVALKAADANARCPFVCSGTLAAADGCRDGAAAGEQAVREIVSRLGVSKAQRQLQTRVVRRDAQRNIRRYFPSGPRPERES